MVIININNNYGVDVRNNIKTLLCIFNFFLFFGSQTSYASGTMSDTAIKNVTRVEVTNEKEQKQLSMAAGLLADYEIEANKLISALHSPDANAKDINHKALKLLNLSEVVIESARFRLPQCDDYLTKALALKNELETITHANLEKDYHHDAALPKAPAECYHTKDLFVHPATVVVLTRDDPSLNDVTKSSINAEITEVLGHTELVRQLIIY